MIYRDDVMTPKSASAPAHFLATCALLRGVEDTVIATLSAASKPQSLTKGEVFQLQGQTHHRFFLVQDGWCASTKTSSEGHETISQIFRSGDLLPDYTPSDQRRASLYNLQSLTDSRLIVFLASAVDDAMASSPRFAANMLEGSVRRAGELRDHIEQLTLASAEQRVGRFLLQVRQEAGGEEPDIVLPFDKAMIASYLGIKPETFSRVLQQFKEMGFVVERNHLVLPTHQALCDYCDSTTARNCQQPQTDCP